MRIALKLIAFIVIVAVAAAIALPFIIDPNDYKQQISDQVEKTTGRQLTLEGDIGLSVFPWLALELGPLSLSNAKNFTADEFAKVSAAEIRVKLLPLLKKQLEMDTVILDGLELNLEKNKAGKTNWDDLAQGNSNKAEKKAAPSAEKSKAPALAAISVAGVKLSNANIHWLDHSKDQQINITNLNLDTDPLVPGEPTALNLAFDVSNNKPDVKAHIELSSDVTVDLDHQRYTLSDLTFQTNAEGDALPLAKVNVSLSGDIDADMMQQKIDLSGMLLEMQDMAIRSNLQVTDVSSANPAITGNIDIAPFNLRQLAKQLAVELPVMSDDSSLEFIQLSSQIAGSSDRIAANDLVVKLDQSTLTGDVSVNNFADPAIKFALKLDEIDADRYLPPPATEKGKTKTNAPAGPATASGAAAAQLPLDTLRKLNINGVADIGKLKISGTHSEQIHLEINAKDGVVQLQPMSAKLYQGQYDGNVQLDASGKRLKVAIDEKLADVQIGPLLKDMTGDDKISGKLTTSVKLSGQGNTTEQIKQTLSGNGLFAFTDGALKGINIAGSIRKAKAALKGETIPDTGEVVKTDFSNLQGSFKATNGVINNQDLMMMSPLLRVTGSGTADIVKETIDYNLKASIVKTSKGQGGETLSELKGVTVPVKITGSFSDPKPTVDLASIAKEKASAEIKEKLNEKISEKLDGKLDGELGGILGNALGGKQDEQQTEPNSDTTEQQTEPEATPEDKVKDAIENKLKSFF